MKSLTKLVLFLALINLSGCAFLNSLRQGGSNDTGSGYPSLQTFQFEGALIHYKDLSNPCDATTVAWNDLREVVRIQQVPLDVVTVDCFEDSKSIQSVAVTRFEVEHQFSVPFETRKTELSDDNNAKSLEGLGDFVTSNTQFQIYGAAGTVGKRSEKLGIERASTVRDHLISLGVQHERITIMPYDAQIPGLQALVKVLRPVIL